MIKPDSPMNQTPDSDAGVAIVGGGIMGLTLAYRLAQHGIKVDLYERSENPGGLASFLLINGARVDRFYHTILSSDTSMHCLIEETGVADKRHFTETKQGFYDNGQLYPFNTPRDLLSYPPLNIFQRFRLGYPLGYPTGSSGQDGCQRQARGIVSL